MSTSPFLLGAFAPVTCESFAGRLPVTGTVPVELDGLFTQIGPNPIRPPKHTDVARYQWFAQDGMISGVRIRDGQAQWFRNRWIRSSRVSRVLGEPRTPGPRHFPIDTVHTNVISHGGLLLALVETGCAPVQITADLDTVAYTDLGGALPHGLAAHPKLDPQSGELHAFVYSPLRSWGEYTVLDRSGALRKSVRIPLGGRPMMHDIALTENYVLLFDLPVRFGFAAAARGRFPYHWDERHQTRLGVINRHGDSAVRYRRLFDTGAADPLSHGGQPWEWSIDVDGGAVSERQLDDRLQELPRVNPDHLTDDARYHYAITAGADRIANHTPDALLKHDLNIGHTEIRRTREDITPTEAVFIPYPGTTGRHQDEDAGWLLHYSYHHRSNTSDLVILNAQDFTGPPAATIHLPAKVPFGFHSSWISGTELAPHPPNPMDRHGFVGAYQESPVLPTAPPIMLTTSKQGEVPDRPDRRAPHVPEWMDKPRTDR